MAAASTQAEGSSRRERIERAILLLEQALQIIDGLQDAHEVGARLHGIIESLKHEGNH